MLNEAVKRKKQVGFNIWTREPFDQNIQELLRKEMRAILLCPKNVSLLGIRSNVEHDGQTNATLLLPPENKRSVG